VKDLLIATITMGMLLGCTTTPVSNVDILTKNDVISFIDIMLGEFKTHPENKENQILDRRVLIKSANLEGHWIYSQLNTGPDKKVYRQRVSKIAISKDGKAIVQKSYVLKTPEQFTEFWGQADIFNSLSENDLERFANEGCVQKWTKAAPGAWKGYVDPNTCLIRSKRRNVDIRVEAESKISGDIYKTNERGFDVERIHYANTRKLGLCVCGTAKVNCRNLTNATPTYARLSPKSTPT